MRQRLVDYLVCPKDGSALELTAWKSKHTPLQEKDYRRAERLGINPEKLTHDILEGVLINRERKLFYPICGGVPRMLLFETAIAKEFVKVNHTRLQKELPGYRLAGFESAPGEKEVLRTFSSEWVNYDWDGQSYWNVTPDAMYQSLRFMLDLDSKPALNQRVLEVGIGCGGMADRLIRQQGCELVGIDLSYAVQVANKHFSANPFFHIVQASVFAPPFRSESFNLVYSYGVLHHTHSTKKAFESISKLPKRRGRLFIWVYSHEDERRTLLRRVLMRVETVMRPVLTRLPSTVQGPLLMPLVPLYLMYQNLFVCPSNPHAIRYGVREAMHAARDRLTPRFVHRHNETEVIRWFKDAGFSSVSTLRDRPRPSHVPVAVTACTGVEGIRE